MDKSITLPMTEDGTFDKLRRTPRPTVELQVYQAFKKIQFNNLAVPEWMEIRKKILNKNGWSEKDYLGL